MDLYINDQLYTSNQILSTSSAGLRNRYNQFRANRFLVLTALQVLVADNH